MGTLIKFILAIIIVWLGYAFILNNEVLLKDKYEDTKQNLVEYINPVAKEERLLGDLDENLNAIKSYVDKLPESEVLSAQSLLEETREIASQIDEVNDKKASTISAQVNQVEKLIKKFPGSDAEVAGFTYTDDDGISYKCSIE